MDEDKLSDVIPDSNDISRQAGSTITDIAI
jgi:hypothetical protein